MEFGIGVGGIISGILSAQSLINTHHNSAKQYRIPHRRQQSRIFLMLAHQGFAHIQNDAIVDDLDAHDDALRKRKCLITIVTSMIFLFVILLDARQKCPGIPLFQKPLPQHVINGLLNSADDFEDFKSSVRILEENLWARIIALDQYSADATRKSEQPFWDVYRGCDETWYKEYRMSKETFNGIVRDSVPFLYSRPTYSLKSARFRFLRAKVVMATLIRYLAIQSDQHTLGKDFGVRQPCISKRIDRGCRALLSAYYYSGCPDPKIVFPLEAGRRAAAATFYAKCRIPYLFGSIDGSIIKISSPFAVNFIPKEFWSKRKKAYSLNLMVICDHKKRFIFADSRWPGSTCDTGAVARSKFLTNLFVSRDEALFPLPYMILADGGFHKRTCFVAPDLPAQNRFESSFNTSISRARCVVENAFGLLKMKWRRLHQHSIAEHTTIIPQLVLCACVLHNICIDSGDINAEEDAAVRNEDERLADRQEINLACERVLGNQGKYFCLRNDVGIVRINGSLTCFLSKSSGLPMAHNAAALVNAYRVKLRLIYDLWVDMADGNPVALEELRNVYGAEAYEFNNNV